MAFAPRNSQPNFTANPAPAPRLKFKPLPGAGAPARGNLGPRRALPTGGNSRITVLIKQITKGAHDVQVFPLTPLGRTHCPRRR